jgi:hypothetical protein
MLALRLPPDIEKRLDTLARKTGRTRVSMRAKPSCGISRISRISTLPRAA